MKIATFNVNSIRIRIDAVVRWLEAHAPDVLCLQETKCQDADFPELLVSSTGYHVAFRGMKGYNGVAVLSREKPTGVIFGLNDGRAENDEVRIVRALVGDVTVVNTYVPNGHKLHSTQYVYKVEWFGRLTRYFQAHLSPEQPVVWCGDMNVAPEPLDVHSPEKHLRHVCFHEGVRKAYRDVLEWGLVDVFRAKYPDRLQYTFWDYLKPSSLEQNKGWRIDHILATRALAGRCRSVEVDVAPRRAVRASDHTVVWADFDV